MFGISCTPGKYLEVGPSGWKVCFIHRSSVSGLCVRILAWLVSSSPVMCVHINRTYVCNHLRSPNNNASCVCSSLLYVLSIGYGPWPHIAHSSLSLSVPICVYLCLSALYLCICAHNLLSDWHLLPSWSS